MITNEITKRRSVLLALVATLTASLQLVASPDGESIAINFGADEGSSQGQEEPSSAVEGAAGVLRTEVWNNVEGQSGEAQPLVADNNGTSTDTAATVTWMSNNTWSSSGRSEQNNNAPEGNDRNLMAGYLDTNATDTIFVQVDDVPYDVYSVYVYIKGGIIGRGGNYQVNGLECLLEHYDDAAFSGEYVMGSGGDYIVFKKVTGSMLRLEATPVNFRAPINGIEIVEMPGVEITTDPPPAPMNMVATETGALRAIISWDAAEGAARYEVWQNDELAGWVTEPSYEAMNLNPETEYTFAVRSFDDFCNGSESGDALTITTAALAESEGFVVARIYNTGGDASSDDLLDALEHEDFPDNPAQSILQGGVQAWRDFGNNYLGLIQFQLVIEEAGDYTFFIRSDDASEMYLNEDGPEFPTPGGNEGLVVFEDDCCQAFKEPDADDNDGETSDPIDLSPGRYGVTVVWKEGGGGDWVQLAMREAGDDTPAADLPVIGGSNVISDVDVVGSFVSITSQPSGGEISENEPFSFSVAYDFASPYIPSPNIQWLKDGVAIGGADSETLSFGMLSKSDAGKYKASLRVPGMSIETDEVTLTVLDDTSPPRFTVGAMSGGDGNFEIGIGFNEPVDADTIGNVENYSVSAGTIEAVEVLTRSLDNFSENITAVEIPEYHSAKLVVSGLSAGETYSVTLKNVADVRGNAIPEPGVSASFVADDSYSWSVVGGQEAHAEEGVWIDDAVRIGEESFDILSSGVAFWADYDEATFVHQEIEGDFDKIAQVEYQDPSSQWARTGLQARESLDIGKGRIPEEYSDCPSPIIVDPDDPEAEPEICIPEDVRFSRYQGVHASPSVMWNNGGTNGNGTYETNYRNDDGLAGGNQTRGGSSGGGPIDYPNAWFRIKREGNIITTFTGSDGMNWETRNEREFVDLKPSVFVGPFMAPELNNNGATAGLQHSVLARFRNVRDYGAMPVEPEPPMPGGGGITGISISDGSVTIEFMGTLMSSDEVDGTYTAVEGASPPSFSTVAEGSAKFFIAR